MRLNAMRKRSVAAVAALTVLIGLLTATPALATISASIRFPNGATTFFSPFSGPAEITFNFDDNPTGGIDPPQTFNVRLRHENGATIHSQNFTITPQVGSSPDIVQFSWPALNVNSNTRYEVGVHRTNGTQIRERLFTLRPRLVRITSIAPDPFFPTINDGYRDTTDITYQLLANSNPVVIQVFEADSGGGCCGNVVREVTQFVNRVAGTYHFIWNGRGGGGVVLPEGDYWVRITATAYTGIPGSSVPAHVSLDRFYRVTNTATKNGINYHHKSATTLLRSGGSCALDRLTASSDLRIRCRNARVRVFWRWNLPAGPTITQAEITQAAFDLIPVPGYTCGATKRFSGTDSSLRVGALGQRRCRVDKARITYTYIKES
jgi:hypothetical protein